MPGCDGHDARFPFVNPQTRAYLKHVSDPPDWVDLGALVTRLVRDGTFVRSVPAPGGFGYVVSRAGARKLLRMMRTRGICMGVDYALVLNSLDRAQMDTLRKVAPGALPFSVRCPLANEAGLAGGPIDIRAYVHNGPPLVRLRSFDTVIGDRRLPNSVFDRKPAITRRMRDLLTPR